MRTQENTLQIAQDGSAHPFCVSIPNIIFEMKLDPHRFCMWVYHFYQGKNLSKEDWKYFESIGMAEKNKFKPEYCCEVL